MYAWEKRLCVSCVHDSAGGGGGGGGGGDLHVK